MLSLIQKIFISRRLKQTFDTIFDLAILLSVVRLAIVVIASIFEPLLGNHVWYESILNQQKAISISLNTLILVKIYKILHHFLWDHHIKIIDLIEIAVTSMIIKMIFNLNYSRESIALLIVLIASFWVFNYSQKKSLLVDEETHDIDKMKD